jgi:predicted O-methyltransferase YrrM
MSVMGKASGAVLAALRNANNVDLRKKMGNLAIEWEWQHQPARLPKVKLEEVSASAPDVLCSLSASEFGETPVEDVVALCTLVKSTSPQRLFEFGTFTGRTTLNLAINAPKGSHVFTLDLSDEQRTALGGERWENTYSQGLIGSKFRESEYAPNITQLLADSTQFDTKPYSHSVDFVFIDGCHDYDFVKNDTIKALEMLAPGGTIAWHDYVRDFSGVYCFLEEFAASHSLRWIQNTSVAYYSAATS